MFSGVVLNGACHVDEQRLTRSHYMSVLCSLYEENYFYYYKIKDRNLEQTGKIRISFFFFESERIYFTTCLRNQAVVPQEVNCVIFVSQINGAKLMMGTRYVRSRLDVKFSHFCAKFTPDILKSLHSFDSPVTWHRSLNLQPFCVLLKVTNVRGTRFCLQTYFLCCYAVDRNGKRRSFTLYLFGSKGHSASSYCLISKCPLSALKLLSRVVLGNASD